jgi:KaiC/GvpD/RAD55 family RecA-like ATPase
MSEADRAVKYAAKVDPVGQGNRNKSLNNLGITLMARFNLTESELKSICLDWALRCDPPMDRLEAEKTAGSAFAGAHRKKIVGTKRRETFAPSQAVVQQKAPAEVPTGSAEAPSLELLDRMEMAISGKIQLMDFGPWGVTTKLSRALVPGSITVLAGMKGTSKTFFMLQAALQWLKDDVNFSMLMLEWERKFYLQRLLGMLARDSNLSVEEYYAAHADTARASWEQHQETLDAMGYRIFDCKRAMDCEGIVAWLKEQADNGKRIVVIDPVSAKRPSRQPWIDDQNLIDDIRSVVKASGMSVILVTHPKTTRGKDLKAMEENWGDDLAGGKAFGDFTDTVLFLQYLREPKEMSCRVCGNASIHTVNRVLQLRKTRFGRGQGVSIGFHFDGMTLLHNECGSIE